MALGRFFALQSPSPFSKVVVEDDGSDEEREERERKRVSGVPKSVEGFNDAIRQAGEMKVGSTGAGRPRRTRFRGDPQGQVAPRGRSEQGWALLPLARVLDNRVEVDGRPPLPAGVLQGKHPGGAGGSGGAGLDRAPDSLGWRAGLLPPAHQSAQMKSDPRRREWEAAPIWMRCTCAEEGELGDARALPFDRRLGKAEQWREEANELFKQVPFPSLGQTAIIPTA